MSKMASSSPKQSGAAKTITAIHPDIIETHILTRIDGQTLASAACTSPLLHSLCRKEKLWSNICNSTWTSTKHPLIRHAISTFPGGHRSFFSDSFPVLHPGNFKSHRGGHQGTRVPTSELISAVDIHYKNKLVYSKVVVTNTFKDKFLYSTFWVDLLDPEESVKIPEKFDSDQYKCMSNLEEFLTISWILIDPARKRAANVSSLRPVLVQPHWVGTDVHVTFVTVMAAGSVGLSEFAECRIVFLLGSKEGGSGEIEMKDVYLQVMDMDRRCLSGRESLVILQEAMENGKRKKGHRGEEKERYMKYVDIKRNRRERKERRERSLDMIPIIIIWAFIFSALAFSMICLGFV